MNTEKQEKPSLIKIKEYVGKDGLVAFEHGFKMPKFTNDGYKYTYSMVSDNVVFCRKHFIDGTSRNSKLIISHLPEKTLAGIYNSLLKYEKYCKEKA